MSSDTMRSDAHAEYGQARLPGVPRTVRDGNKISGRYVFCVVLASGGKADYECHIFGELGDDGRLARVSEIGRFIEDTDDSDLHL
jgi:hypothetical protein